MSERNLMYIATDMVDVFLSSPDFVVSVIERNVKPLLKEYPSAHIDLALSMTVKQLEKSEEEWMRVLAGLVYASIATNIALAFGKLEKNKKNAGILACMLSWTRAVEILVDTNSRCIFDTVNLIPRVIDIQPEKVDLVIPFVMGSIDHIWKKSQRKAISFVTALLMRLLESDKLNHALELVRFIRNKIKSNNVHTKYTSEWIKLGITEALINEKLGNLNSAIDILNKIKKEAGSTISIEDLAQIIENEVRIFSKLNRYSMALQKLQELESEYIKTNHGGKYVEQLIDVILEESKILNILGRHREALKKYETAEQICYKFSLCNRKIMLSIKANKAMELIILDEEKEALSELECAEKLMAELGSEDIEELILLVYVGKGICYSVLGDYKRAMEYLENAEKVAREIILRGNKSYISDLAIILMRQSAVLVNKGLNDLAVLKLKYAQKLFESLEDKDRDKYKREIEKIKQIKEIILAYS